ncbi:MAG: fimbria/pilus periplasmic chaperone [Candidatus Eremiobacteraeota bacterium]|nr:fimbria/pilus periplasmic chaperone [Candidatus Eremiobacteraeota bacterium]
MNIAPTNPQRCLQLFIAAALVGLAFIPSSEAIAAAAGVTVAPIRVDLSPSQTSSFIQLTNGDSAAKLMHARIFVWDQMAGKDRLTPTQDLIVSPPIFLLQPGSSQILRMGLLEQPSGNVERAYRILITEVPQTTKPDQIRVVLQLSIPLFVAATGGGQPLIQIQGKRGPHQRLELTLWNSGAQHIRFTRLVVRDAASSQIIADSSNSQYVLAGQKMRHIFTLPKSAAATPLSVEAYSEGGIFRSTIALAQP